MTSVLRFATLVFLLGACVAGASAQEPSPVYKPGDDVTAPMIVRKVNPSYTPEAMRARIEGVVRMEIVVLENGRVGEVNVTRSLDQIYGLDKQAVKAAKRSTFKPGTKDGKPVRVLVEMEYTFSLREE